jgi:hypothetical protein
MPHEAPATTAHLDPWLPFGEHGGAGPPRLYLFGWALHHHRLLGLAWIRSSLVVSLDEGANRASTVSGSRYALGRRLASPDELCVEGRVAWAALVLGGVSELEQRWLAARKAARWLGVPPPPLDGDAVDGFVARHGGDYLALRAALAGRRGTA